MINNYNANTENQKLDHKQALAHISTRLKEVLNPTQWIAENLQHRLYFKLSTDLTELSDLTVSVNGITDNNKIILFTGYLSEESLSGINKGSQGIKCLGYYFENSALLVIISIEDPDNTGETEKVRKLLIEIFTQSDTKNHCSEIVNLDEFPIVSDYITVFDGSEEIDWEFKIKGNLSTDDSSVDPRIITIDPLFNSTITKIESAQTAEKLSNNITFNVSGEGVASSTATLDFDENPSEVNLTVDVSLPPASTQKIGGFRVWYDGDGCPQKSDNQCIVRIDDTGNYHFAYIDLNDIDFEDEEQDIHRYSDMDTATTEHPNLGEIVQYIGNTGTNYIHGYFYMRVRELINGSLAVGTNWQFIDPVSGQATLNTKLTEYNKVNDHIITISQPLVFTPIASTIVENTINDDTLFNIVNGSFTDTITYAGIKEWGINLANLTYDSQHPELFVASLGLSYINESNPPVWVQKNVLPAIHMSSALVYKGIIEWDNLEDRTPISEPGDFYTVTDRSNQEYFFNGTITDNWEDSWEFMGKVVNVPTYSLGNGIDITASGNDNVISVKYDNHTIKKNNSGNLYVDGELTDTTYSAGNNISIDSHNYNSISADGYVYDSDKNSIRLCGELKNTSVCGFSVNDTTETNNDYETALGRYNLSTIDDVEDLKEKNTHFSIGIGTESDDPLQPPKLINAFEIKLNGDLYIKGLGDYDGVHFINAKPIQQLFATVATTGSYNDLSNKPTNVSTFTNDAGYLTQHQDISGKAEKSEMTVTDGTGTDADKTTIQLKSGLSATVLKSHLDISGKANTSDLAAVATSGNYSDLSGIPTIPTVNDGKLSIKGNNTLVSEFTANDSSNVNLNISGNTGIEIEATTNNLTISNKTNYIVSEVNSLVITSTYSDVQAQELVIKNALSNKEFKALNLSTFTTSNYLNPKKFVWAKPSAGGNIYAGIFYCDRSAGKHIFELEINDTILGRIDKHLCALIVDTPLSSTFLFSTTSEWEIICKEASESLYVYLCIPSTFAGTITLTPISYGPVHGTGYGSFYTTGSEVGTTYYLWGTSGEDQSVNSIYTIYGNNLSSTGNRLTGRYTPDIFGYLGTGLTTGSKILDAIINDYIIEDLNEKVVINTPVGTIQMYAGSIAPEGWLMCDGTEIQLKEGSSTDYDFYRSVMGGTTLYYKASNPILRPLVKVLSSGFVWSQSGSAYHISLPDLREKFAIGAGSTHILGETDGDIDINSSETTTLPYIALNYIIKY